MNKDNRDRRGEMMDERVNDVRDRERGRSRGNKEDEEDNSVSDRKGICIYCVY